MAKAKESPSIREIVKRDLLDQLERNGTIGQQYTDLVDVYMTLWDAMDALKADIEERGTKVWVETAKTSNLKTNDSVMDALKVNAQMLKILDSLGIKPAQTGGDDGDDEM